ncbi:M56 family metallopeptidase [Chitinophaga sp. S165]|uniref:M56 family metallopeptidase n=1 Tax=Chitinophaga sp. S165 TaxID=2135462 RepID=UPI000D70CB13|nr:M56 family metallopeptidase [Chitinophaga sp. S165]PWV46158.1 BlaR1 peptidase M56 [Chitinophaga sp. S165]
MYPYLNINAGIERFLQAFSWMLVHSLWQGLLLAVVTAVLLQTAKRVKAQLRYNIVFIQFILFILACAWTFIHGLSGPSRSMVPLAGAIGQNASQLLNLDAVNVRLFTDSCAAYISDHAPLLVLIWAIFFTFRSLRMVQGLIYLQKTRSTYTITTADWQERLVLLCRKLHIRRYVRLLESARVKVPMVIGHMKPVILMPAGLLTGLPVEQIEAVLLHELAHIRRHDYLVNLLQTVCETVYFFNPGLLWMSALLRDEREHCCDDIALGQTGNKREFIQALISFKEHAMYNYPSAVAFPGKKNQLLQRVSRIINNKNQSLGTGEKVFFLAGIILLTAILSTAAITQLREIEHDIFSSKHTAKAYYYTPPVQQQFSAIIRAADKPAGSTANNVIENKYQHPTDESSDRSSATSDQTVQPMEVVNANIVQNDGMEVTQRYNAHQDKAKDNSQYGRSQYGSGQYSSSSQYGGGESGGGQYGGEIQGRSQAPFYSPRQRRQPVIRKPYHPENSPRLNRLTASLTVNETAEQRTAREIRERQKEDARLAHVQAEKDRQQSIRDKEQADRDREQAIRDRAQAERDREQAVKDRMQAERDREQAVKDRMQADRDREQANRDRMQAEKDRQQAILDRLQGEKDRAQAEADKRRQTQFPAI